MEKKDSIKELFNDRFKDFEANVDASVWQGVESKIQPSPVTGAVTFSKASIWMAGAAVVLGVVAIGYFATNPEVTNQEDVISEVVIEEEPVEVNTSEVVEEENVSLETDNASTSESGIASTENNSNERTHPTIESENTEVSENEVSQGNSNPIENTTKENTTSPSEVIANGNAASSLNEPEIVVNSTTPNEIVVEEQSTVMANPMGGVAPLSVSFSSLAKISKVKWDFDDGTTSAEVNPSHVYEREGIYFVTMIAETESGEVVMDKAVVEVLKSTSEFSDADESEIFVPNVFTPNGDGIHDELVVTMKNIKDYSISIYSVNGKLVYQSNDPNENWKGTDMRGALVQQGTYYYLVNAKGLDGNMYAPKGYITVR